MKRINKLTSLLLATLIVLTGVMSLSTVAHAEYLYTIRVYLGGMGDEGASFKDSSASYIDFKKEAGERFEFDPHEGVIISSTDAKYKVIGARKSGDNKCESTIDIAAVTQDETYVIAYGVYKTIPYTAVFVDENGNAIVDANGNPATDETYYGIDHTQFYVPYKEIEGYYPINGERYKAVTLSEAGEVIRFVYTNRPGDTYSTSYGADSVTYSTVVGDPTYTYQTIPGMPVEEVGITDNRAPAGGGNAAGGEAAGEAGGADDTTTIGEADVPLGGDTAPTNIPEPENPKGKDEQALFTMYIRYLIIIAVIGLLIAFITIIGTIKVNYDKNHRN
ncbi:hypothetical protein NXH64_07900 [Butyrivibrio fibrisolvens]|uniref:hypothetical protein n=1 Tax=Pseudobutyrivibrio ruminis TaxID=46206 RepID=UPI000400680D|nr:hypothetical protein [Pseudobutyrivibrio ruminis]MDC7279426.1 hypothetical protein [Butyrivibrio fibrisolvens]